jgi:ABC-2 type transport system permease protein
LGGGLAGDPDFAALARFREASMMPVASQDKKIVARNGFASVRPELWLHASTSGRHRVRRHWENSPRWLVPHTGVLVNRILRRWSRDAATVIESLIMPLALLVTLNIVLGDGISQVTGHSALYGTAPLAAMVGAMTGAMVTGISLMRERTDGLLSRLWVLPVHRASGVLSRLAADAVRIVVTTAIILCVGLLLGLRFRQGILGSVAWLVIPTALGVAFSVGVITLALYSANTVMVELTEGIWAVLMFFSTGFVPLDQFPRWIQPAVEHQPVSCAIEAMRGVSLGGPVLAPMVEMLLWSAGIAAACAMPMAIGYRRASMRE